jgi:pyruvate carboxylase
VRAITVDDKSAAVETASREKATSDPGSVGAPMSGVVVEVRVKEGQEVKKGDILCGESMIIVMILGIGVLTAVVRLLVLSAMKMESPVSAPVSGHIKRVLVNEGDSLNQGDLLVEVVH